MCVCVCVCVWVWVCVCVYVCVCVDLWVAGAEKIGSISAAGLMLALAAGFIGMVRYVFFGVRVKGAHGRERFSAIVTGIAELGEAYSRIVLI